MMKPATPLVALCLMCLAGPGAAQELALEDLMIRDGDQTKRYSDVVSAPKSAWWMKGLPLATFESSLAFMPPQGAWMKAYDFNGNGWLSTNEMTQAWMVQIASWRTGKQFGPDAIISADGKPMRGVMLSIPAERRLRAAVDDMSGSTLKGVTAAQEKVREVRDAMVGVYYESMDGGDGGRGTESDQGQHSLRVTDPDD